MAKNSKMAFGKSADVEKALEQGLINEFDLLLLDGDTDKPKVGWIDKDGNTIIVTDEKADLTGLEEELAKTNAAVEEVDAEVEAVTAKVTEVETMVETKADEDAVAVSYERVKFEIADVPIGTLVDYRDKEIRVMCPSTTAWTKQAVGAGGDANTHYVTLKTYAPEGVTGYKEILSGQADPEILTDLKEDAYGRRYQPTWLGVAKYDEASATWSYYGANSSEEKYIGWDYAIEWYKDDVLVQVDSVRINLSNEDCHGNIKPSYVSAIIAEMKTYCDEQIVEKAGQIPVVEF